MGRKGNAFIRYGTQARQTKDLKTAAVRKDGFVPVHKGMQTAPPGNHIIAGPQVKMIGVAQNNLGVHGIQIMRVKAFYRPKGSNGHEDGSLDAAVGRDERACSGCSIRGFKGKKGGLGVQERYSGG